MDPLKRQIFRDACAQIFSLILRPCHMYIKLLNHVYIILGLEIGPKVYLRTKKNIAVVHIVGSVLTNATIVTMHPFRMHI